MEAGIQEKNGRLGGKVVVITGASSGAGKAIAAAFAKEGAWLPAAGMWFSTAILVPIGIFLTYKAMHDSQLFSKEFYTLAIRKFKDWRYRRQQTGNLT